MNKDTSLIPKGPYCYTWLEYPSVKNNFVGKTKCCSYYETKNVNGVAFPWCNYLDAGGTPGDNSWSGWENYENAEKVLEKHFGSKEKMEEKLSLFLLFDGCKECGVNDNDV